MKPENAARARAHCIKIAAKRAGTPLSSEHRKKLSKRVLCEETGQVYESGLAASAALNIPNSTLAKRVARGKQVLGMYTLRYMENA